MHVLGYAAGVAFITALLWAPRPAHAEVPDDGEAQGPASGDEWSDGPRWAQAVMAVGGVIVIVMVLLGGSGVTVPLGVAAAIMLVAVLMIVIASVVVMSSRGR